MACCERFDIDLDAARAAIDRRSALKSLAGVLGLAAVGGRAAKGQATDLKLAFCGQLLCVVPYEVTRHRGHFAAEGLNVELVYTRGGNAAMQALVGGAVDYAGTSFDVAVQAFANGAGILRFASTGRLPLFALAVAPGRRDDITSVADLAGTTVGVSALGNADHTLLLYLMAKAGVDPDGVRFATLGTNLYDALRLGQVDAGMVQEPSLSLIVADGGTTLVNMMDIADAERHLGGAYEFMGVTIRADEREARLEEMKKLARALERGLQDTRTLPVEELIAALPPELIAGGDQEQLKEILLRYRESLYPESVRIDLAAAERVIEALAEGGTLETAIDLDRLLDRTVIGG
jgi:NitT/TauT family transport system substrate-binding protein